MSAIAGERTDDVCLRPVEESDLVAFFEHQRDPVAVQMAAFPPRDHAAFMAHWHKILLDPSVIARTILRGGDVVGNAVCWRQSDMRLVGYWLGRSFWGQGIASRALTEFVAAIPERPLYARVAKDNVASIRVLQKAGFQCTGEGVAAAAARGDAVEEFVYVLP